MNGNAWDAACDAQDEPDDAALITAVLDGETACFSPLVIRYQTRVMRFILKYEREKTIIHTYKITAIAFNKQQFLIGFIKRTNTYKMNTALWKTAVSVFKNKGTLCNVVALDQMCNINKHRFSRSA